MRIMIKTFLLVVITSFFNISSGMNNIEPNMINQSDSSAWESTINVNDASDGSGTTLTIGEAVNATDGIDEELGEGGDAPLITVEGVYPVAPDSPPPPDDEADLPPPVDLGADPDTPADDADSD